MMFNRTNASIQALWMPKMPSAKSSEVMRSPSPVNLAQDDVERAENGHRVGNVVTDRHLLQGREVAERSPPDPQPVWARSAPGDQVDAVFAAWILAAHVDLIRS